MWKRNPRRWSKLQHQLYKIIATDIGFQIHCAVYPMHSQYGSTGLPRYWITLEGEIIFDYPKQFGTKERTSEDSLVAPYPYETDVSDISNLIREYIDTQKEELLTKVFENDSWGLIDILRAADRRIGMRQLEMLKSTTQNIAAHKIIDARMAYQKIL